MEHHQLQGVDQVDTDVPTQWEVDVFTNAAMKVLWLILQPAFYGLRPLFVKPKKQGKWEYINTAAVLTTNVIVVYFLGWKALLYLVRMEKSVVDVCCTVVNGLFLLLSRVLKCVRQQGLSVYRWLELFLVLDFTPLQGISLQSTMNSSRDMRPIRTMVLSTGINAELWCPCSFPHFVFSWPSFFYYVCRTNWNVGYHNEHHDFPKIPWSRLSKVKKIAPEFYDNLPSYNSYLWVMWKYITDPTVGPWSRVKRKVCYLMRYDMIFFVEFIHKICFSLY